MAQWNGQFTGNTHQTKIEDLEAALRHAIEVFREADSDSESFAKGKIVCKLAEKLLIARLKFLKAKIYDAEPVLEENQTKQNKRVEVLRQEEERIRIEGVNGILVEFDAKSLVS